MSKLHIKKGDIVYVNTGEDKGKTGRVLKVLVDDKRAIVEGVNMVTKHTKPSAKHPQGGREKMELSVHISNLNPVDPKSGKPTRVGRKEVKPDKPARTAGRDKNEKKVIKLVRYAKRSGEELK